MPGKRLSEREREAIADDLRATIGTPEGSFAKVGKRHNRAISTIKRVCDQIGLSVTEATRSTTKNATIAHSERATQLRQELSMLSLLEAKAAIEDLRTPVYVYNFGGKDNVFADAVAARPSPADRARLTVAYGTLIDKHGVLERFESDNQHRAHMDAYLAHIFGGVRDDADAA